MQCIYFIVIPQLCGWLVCELAQAVLTLSFLKSWKTRSECTVTPPSCLHRLIIQASLSLSVWAIEWVQMHPNIQVLLICYVPQYTGE